MTFCETATWAHRSSVAHLVSLHSSYFHRTPREGVRFPSGANFTYQSSTVTTIGTTATFRNENIFGFVATTWSFVWCLFRTDCSSGCEWDRLNRIDLLRVRSGTVFGWLRDGIESILLKYWYPASQAKGCLMIGLSLTEVKLSENQNNHHACHKEYARQRKTRSHP
jgi:hypothetical protein